MAWDNGVREHVSPNFTVGGKYGLPLAANHDLTLGLDLPFNFDGHTADQLYGVGISRDAAGNPTGGSGLSGTVHVGAEYWYRHTLALRSGLMGRDLTFGAGLRYEKLGVDYAAVFNRFLGSDISGFTGDGNLDVTHRISGSYSF